MAETSNHSLANDQADKREEARMPREWIKPEIVTLDLETAQATGGGIP